MFQKMSREKARSQARMLVEKLSIEEKIRLVGGTRGFFTQAVERLGIPEVMMTDASQGVNIRTEWLGRPMEPCLEKSVAFPAMIMLAATWNPDIAESYARSIGEECRAAGVGVLLGPGMNIYRHAQAGRNFEYLGEDPLLARRLISSYVEGLQGTGVVATLKHFIANNTDYFRRKSNSVVDDRALHEIYLPAFKAGVEAGAFAVMTAYNLFNGEWCSQNQRLIKDTLRGELGFDGLVMTDWWAINDAAKAILSGQDLEMPALDVLEPIPELIESGEITESDLDGMVENQIATFLAAGLYDKDFKDTAFLFKFPEHEKAALACSEEGTVLLKNDGILPLAETERLLVTGRFVETIPRGGGAAIVEGYDQVTLGSALEREFPNRVILKDDPSDDDLRTASTILVSCGTLDHEGWDRPFELDEEEEKLMRRCVSLNSRCVVVVNSGGGIRMTDWHNRAAAILYGWYPGQNGFSAVAGILSGRVNPSGKLPISIERSFKDSPGFDSIPPGEKLYSGWHEEEEKLHEVYDVEYREGVFVGYRWYERKGIRPLYPFGHGLSYSRFEISEMRREAVEGDTEGAVAVISIISNLSECSGATVLQLYVEALNPKVDRPVKELRAFRKVFLDAREKQTIRFKLEKDAFAYWNTEDGAWQVDEGSYRLHLGFSSEDLPENLEWIVKNSVSF